MPYPILQSSTEAVLLFFMVQSSDHITALTGASPTVTISKNGAAFGSPSGTVSEIANGWYKVAGNATDTNTLGPLALHATATSGDPCDLIVAMIVGVDPQATVVPANVTQISGSAVSTSTAQLGVNAVQINAVSTSSVTTINANQGTTQPVNFTGTGGSALAKVDVTDIATAAVNTGSAQLGVNVVSQANIDFGALQKASLNAATPASVTGSVGSVTAAVNVANPVRLVKNTAFNNFAFLMIDSTDHVSPKTGLTITAKRSLDGGAFAACANSATELSNGWYLINLATTDTNANSIIFLFTATGADATNIFVATNIS